MPGVEHAVTHVEAATLCGIAGAEITVFRHLFIPESPRSCRECQAAAQAAPSAPGPEERLHNALGQTRGVLRDDLVEALRCGARIHHWVTGPAQQLAARPARATLVGFENGPAVAEALATTDRVSLAIVLHPPSQYVAVFPPAASPLIARGPQS
jgi:hypothetical protein